MAQLGSRMRYAVPKIFYQTGQLQRLYTDLLFDPSRKSHRLAARWLPKRIANKFIRNNPNLPSNLVKSSNFEGLATKSFLALAHSPLTQLEVFNRSAHWLAKRIIADEDFQNGGFIYGFDTASLELFSQAKCRSVRLVLEQCVAPRKSQAEILGALFTSANIPITKNQTLAWERQAEIEQNEWNLADIILCPSRYVVQELIKHGVPPLKLRLVPYGVEALLPEAAKMTLQRRLEGRNTNKFRVLFAGQIGLRKGVLELIAAAQALDRNNFEFVAAGKLDLPPAAQNPFHEVIKYLGNLSPQELHNEYEKADCLVHPSHLEGSATVVYEALSWGLPVVTTHSSGTVVENGVSGFVGGAGDVNFLVSSLNRLRTDEELRRRMASNAWDQSQLYNLDGYKQRLLSAVATIP